MLKRTSEAFDETVRSAGFPSFKNQANIAEDLIDDLGWQLIHWDSWTTVFISPDEKKVARVNIAGDYAFQIYADICARMPHNPYFQNVFDSFVLRDGTHVAILEKLDTAKEEYKPISDLSNFLNNGYEYPELIRKFMADRNLLEALRMLHTTTDQYFGTDASICPGLDTKPDNIMLRARDDGTHEIVLSDPLCIDIFQDDELTQLINPWEVRLRRMLGLMDPPYFRSLNDMDTRSNTWRLNLTP